MSQKPIGRWYQFSLLTLILLTTAVSVPLAWLAYERNEVHKTEKVIATIGKLGGSVELGEAKAFPPNWLRPLLGGRTPGEIATADVPGTKVTDADLSQFAWLTKLKAVSLYNCTEVTGDITESCVLGEIKKAAYPAGEYLQFVSSAAQQGQRRIRHE